MYIKMSNFDVINDSEGKEYLVFDRSELYDDSQIGAKLEDFEILKKLNTPPAEQNQSKPKEEQKDNKLTTNENEIEEEEDDDDDDEQSKEGKNNLGTNEDLQGKLKKNEEISGKSIPGNKK